MSRSPYCSRCGIVLYRSGINNMWRCSCRTGANMPKCYDEKFVPYPVAEPTPKQIPMGVNFCSDCDDTRQSRRHRQECIPERMAFERAARERA